MLLEFTLCGHKDAWTLRDKDGFATWLGDRARQVQDPAVALCIGQGPCPPELLEALGVAFARRKIRPLVADLAAPVAATDAKALLAAQTDPSWLAVDLRQAAAAKHDLGERLRRHCGELHRVVAIVGDTDIRWGPAYDLVQGRPDGSLPFAPLTERWLAYLHHRIAWEAAGSPWLARQEWQCRLDEVRTGDDKAVDRVLNDVAIERFRRLPSAERRDLLYWERNRLHADSASRADMEVRLASRGHIWRPDDVTLHAHLSPWLARALLLCVPDQVASPASARADLNCGFLVRQVAFQVLTIEIRLREKILSEYAPPPPEAVLVKFKKEMAQRSSLLPQQPCAPEVPWEYATVGDLIESLGNENPRPYLSSLFKFRDLRNHLLHGRHVTWNVLKSLVEVVDALRT